MKEVKRYDAVHLRYEESNIRYGEGCEVEVVAGYDYDALAAQIEWIQEVNTLHRQVEILYVVDGYEVTIEWDGVAISPDFHGETVSDAIEKAMAGFDLAAAPKWVGGERSVQEPVDRQLAAAVDQRDALLAERDELLAALKAMCEEFRGHDLPYGSKAYCAATTAINKSEYPQ
jgi:hypothetical protein